MSRAREIADLVGGTTPDIILKTADGAILNLQTSDTTVTDGSVLGAINFTAPNEASGTDSLLIGGAIQAVAEGTFAADNNATELVFMTGASEAASSKMVLSSAGALTVTGVVTANAGVVVDNITIDGNDISTTDTNGNLTITPNGTGDLLINSDRIKIRATEGETATIVLAADEDDDNGDTYKLVGNLNGTFAIQNDISVVKIILAIGISHSSTQKHTTTHIIQLYSYISNAILTCILNSISISV